MHPILKYFSLLLLLSAFVFSFDHKGELTVQFSQSDKENLSAGVRFVPELFWSIPEYNLDADLALNAYMADGQDSNAKVHRLWGRYSGDQLEVRAGLQKINFGSAMLFRPLQWFDSMDPLDPLGFTEGVKGVLGRYYLPNNANGWLWCLYDNRELKGREIAPTAKETAEWGGRLQTPLFNGETGITYHQRKVDFSRSPTFSILSNTAVPEERIGIDGKWDIGIGIWVEAVQVTTKTDLAIYPNRQYHSTIGADYTFGIGNGLNILVEKFNFDTDLTDANKNTNTQIHGIMANYPLGLYDTISVLQIYAEKNDSLTFSWQRTYDDLILQLTATAMPDYNEKNKTTGALQIMISYNY